MKIEINKNIVKKNVKAYLKNNILFLTFVLSSVINSFLLRVITVKFSYNQIKPLLADIAVTMFIGLFAYCFKPKRQFPYFMVWTSVFAILSAGNSIYYTNYKSFLSVALASTASQLGGVADAVTDILELKHIMLLWPIVAMIVVYVLLRKKRPDYFDNLEKKHLRKKYAVGTLAVSVAVAGIFAATLTGTDYSRLKKQWNREYVLGTFGLYTYQISDTVSCVNAKLNMLMGFSESEQAFKEFYGTQEEKEEVKETDKKANEYSDIFKGKNIITIHAESIQQFTMDTYINGKELTPNLNKLAKEGLYFSNFYAQESVGTSSDSEFTFASSLMPASSGTVAINYWDRDYTTTQSMLRDMGYYTFSMHGNNGSYWNRLNLHEALGYEKFFNYTSDFEIDETIGLGLSDKSFFSQAIPKIKEISKEHKNYYGALLMLTNHTPFTDIERVSDFEVDFKFKKYNEETGLYEEISRPFLEGTKLGSYFKSVHYADEAIGQLMNDLDKEGLLDNTVIIIYGDHDAKIKESDYEYYYNYDPFTDKTLNEGDEGYIPIDDFYYNVNRKVPFIIWSKDGGYEPAEITQVMGMYDVQPTLGNMFGFSNKFALGHDIFSFKEGTENTVIFPNGNFVTDTIYYDSQKNKYFDLKDYDNVAKYASCNQAYKDTPNPIYNESIHGLFKTLVDENYSVEALDKRISDGVVDDAYISEKSAYAEERISISNAVIYYDMINKTTVGFGDDMNTFEVDSNGGSVFAPPSSKYKKRILVP
ncbi:MAG: LTA synthase family protein [Oscillospiraceae bacterium]